MAKPTVSQDEDSFESAYSRRMSAFSTPRRYGPNAIRPTSNPQNSLTPSDTTRPSAKHQSKNAMSTMTQSPIPAESAGGVSVTAREPVILRQQLPQTANEQLRQNSSHSQAERPLSAAKGHPKAELDRPNTPSEKTPPIAASDKALIADHRLKAVEHDPIATSKYQERATESTHHDQAILPEAGSSKPTSRTKDIKPLNTTAGPPAQSRGLRSGREVTQRGRGILRQSFRHKYVDGIAEDISKVTVSNTSGTSKLGQAIDSITSQAVVTSKPLVALPNMSMASSRMLGSGLAPMHTKGPPTGAQASAQQDPRPTSPKQPGWKDLEAQTMDSTTIELQATLPADLQEVALMARRSKRASQKVTQASEPTNTPQHGCGESPEDDIQEKPKPHNSVTESSNESSLILGGISFLKTVRLDSRSQLVQQLGAHEKAPDQTVAAYNLSSDGEKISEARLSLDSSQRRNCETAYHRSSHFGHTGCTRKHDLADWNGQLLPSPVEWECRKQFRPDSKAFQRVLQYWLDWLCTDMLQDPCEVDTSNPAFLDGGMPCAGTRQPYQSKPSDAIFVEADQAISYGPIEWDRIPTWESQDPSSLAAPGRKECSTTRSATYLRRHRNSSRRRQKRISSFSSDSSSSSHERGQDPQSRAGFNGRYQQRQAYSSDPNAAGPFDPAISPKVNFYVRSAISLDSPQIATIYNEWVLLTNQAIELFPTTVGEWNYRIAQADGEKKPFLVAVLKNMRRGKRSLAAPGPFGPSWRNNRRIDRLDPSLNGETVVGFAYAERFGAPQSSFQSAVELFVYVRRDLARQGVGKNLFDRILPALDPNYFPRRGVAVFLGAGESRLRYLGGGQVTVKKIVMTLFYGEEREDIERFRWQKKQLEQRWNFRQASLLVSIAEKFGKPYSMAQFVRETASGDRGPEGAFTGPRLPAFPEP